MFKFSSDSASSGKETARLSSRGRGAVCGVPGEEKYDIVTRGQAGVNIVTSGARRSRHSH